MVSELYRVLAERPVYDEDLIIIQEGCTHCSSELAGEFTFPSYDRLDTIEHELLRVFLTSRRNLREVEKYLQVSYPAARARLDTLLVRLGMNPDVQPTPPQSDKPGPAEQREMRAVIPQEQVLARVVIDETSAKVAAQLTTGPS